MSVTIGSRPHLGERDLLRYIDREMDRKSLRDARVHLTGCARCRARLDEAKRRAEEVSAWVGELRVEAPDPERRAAALAALRGARRRRAPIAPGARALLQAAAIVMLLVGATVGTAPGRSFIGDTVERFSGPRPGPVAARILGWLDREPPALALESVSARPPEDAAGPAAETDAVVARRNPGMSAGSAPPVPFEPRANFVIVEFDSFQRAGVAVIRIGEVQEATAQVTAGLRGERIVPLPDGVRVRNGRASGAHYAVTVPGHYRYVRVRIAGQDEILLRATRAKQEWIWTVSLTEERRGN